MAVTLTSERFVGREEELGRIARVLERSGEGTPATIILTGSGGLGSTRLLGETRRRLSYLPDRVAVIAARAFPGWRGRPFAPVAAALCPILERAPDATFVELVGPTGDALALALPQLRSRLAELDLLPRRAPVVAPERRLARILEAIGGLLGRLGEQLPVLFIVEDLHVADAATRALVTFLARTARQQRITLIGTYQPDEITRAHPLHADLRAIAEVPRPAEEIVLRPFDGPELAELIEGIEGERPSASVLLLVTERSGGNPLVAEELLAARRELSGASLTGSLERLVTARVALRSPECRRVLRLLALAGEPLARQQLAAVAAAFEAAEAAERRLAQQAGRPVGRGRHLPPRSATHPRRSEAFLDADLSAGLAEALADGILVEATDDSVAPSGRGPAFAADDGSPDAALQLQPAPDRLLFRHDLVARAVAADLLPGVRRRYEAAIAEVLAESPAAAVAHWLAAYQLTEARNAAIEAAEAADVVGSGQDALAHYDIALALHEPAIGNGASSGGRHEPAARRLRPTGRPEGGPDIGPAGALPGGGLSALPGGPEDAGERGPAERRLPEIRSRAADAAYAAGDASRAVAFAESAIAVLDERLDWPALGVLWERLGRYRRAAGDHEGAVEAHRRAVAVVPAAVSRERAHVLAGLAQVTMLEGTFSEAESAARESIEVATGVGDEAAPELVHALVTLAIVKAWGDEPEDGIRMLREARSKAAEIGQLDDFFRAYANLTTALDVLGRREEAIAVATEGIADADRYGQATVYGNYLRGNAADSLFVLGRWEESRALSAGALAWSPAGIGFLSPLLNLATVQIESSVGEAPGRLLGQLLLELETVRDVQFSVPAYQAAASYALWQEDPVDARRVVERGWARIRQTEDWVLIARMAASVLEVYAAGAADAHRRRSLETVAELRASGGPVMELSRTAVERAGVPATVGSRREADTFLATAAAFQRRLDGRDDPAAWEEVAAAWDAQGAVYRAARARWRLGEALLAAEPGRIGRSKATRPVREAAEVAAHLGARPLLRALLELAGRARIALPTLDASLAAALPTEASTLPLQAPALDSVGSTAGIGAAERADGSASTLVRGFVTAGQPTRKNTFALSPREREVLSLIAEGRTNLEIGERLYISHRTVGIHVSNILAKLGVSGRVEAAAVAIRLGLTEAEAPPNRRAR